MKYTMTTCTALTLITSAFCHTSFEPEDKVNYPSNYQVASGVDLFLFGDYLYWTAREDGLNYVQTGKKEESSIGYATFKGHLKKITPEWDSAFRVGAGLNFPRSGFDLIGIWTQFSTQTSNSSHAKKGTTLLPIWAHPDAPLTASATAAQAQWNLRLNSIDLECARSSWFGGCFSIRPFFGARWLWIEQSARYHYDYATTPKVVGKLHSSSDFNGGGIRAGVDLRYALGSGFSLLGLISGALLYTDTTSHFQLKEEATIIGKSRSHSLEGMSTLQANLALSWDSHFCKDRCHMELHIGWEQNAYFNANQMQHYLSQLGQGKFFQEKGTLTLQGLIAGGRFDF